MAKGVPAHFVFSEAGLALALILSGGLVHAQSDVQDLPNMGQQISPLAPVDSRFEPLNSALPYDPAFLAGQGWLAGHAVTTVVSPDHKTLLVLTSGYNRVSNTAVQFPASWYLPDSTEYVFIYDISTPAPIKKQALQIPNTYNGIVFDPSGSHFYVAGGPSDNIHTITLSATGTWVEEQPKSPALALGHNNSGVGLGVLPCAAGVAISNDGKTLVVANYYNDSVTVFNGGYGNWSKVKELDLRPGKNDPSKSGTPGGEYPFWVVVKGTGTSGTVYVSSIRDREIVVVKLGGAPGLFGPVGSRQ